MTDRTLGIWTDWDHGVTTDMKKYKLDMYVRGVPLYCNYLPHNRQNLVSYISNV